MHYNNWNEGVGGLGAELNMLNTQVRRNSLNIALIVQSSPDPCHVINKNKGINLHAGVCI